MLKGIIISSLVLLLAECRCNAQNLVPNPGFELMNGCSETFSVSTLENTSNWFNVYGSSVDWYSTCFCSIPGTLNCPPNLYLGTGFPNSGVAMVGLCPYSEITHAGESLGVKLLHPLVKDSAYCFSFHLKNSYNHNLSYIMREFNVAFVTDTAGISHPNDIISFTTVSNLNDDGWHSIESYYIAKGGEQFMLFGFFDGVPDYYLEDSQSIGKYMYYFFDDFNVVECNKDSLLAVYLDLPNVLTCDGNKINDEYHIRMNNISKLNIQVYNRWGNLVKEYDAINEVWTGRDAKGELLTEGVYFVKAIGESAFGETVQKAGYVHLIRPSN